MPYLEEDLLFSMEIKNHKFNKAILNVTPLTKNKSFLKVVQNMDFISISEER